MQPFLQKEYILWSLENQMPFDASKAIMELDAIQRLAQTSTPVKITVNMFRRLQGYGVPLHPDSRGNALITDPDVVNAGDDQPTSAELLALRAKLITNNEAAYVSGDLAKDYPDLWALTGG
jgi:hypothetical protein